MGSWVKKSSVEDEEVEEENRGVFRRYRQMAERDVAGGVVVQDWAKGTTAMLAIILQTVKLVLFFIIIIVIIP